jgi:hypothetical protein
MRGEVFSGCHHLDKTSSQGLRRPFACSSDQHELAERTALEEQRGWSTGEATEKKVNTPAVLRRGAGAIHVSAVQAGSGGAGCVASLRALVLLLERLELIPRLEICCLLRKGPEGMLAEPKQMLWQGAQY